MDIRPRTVSGICLIAESLSVPLSNHGEDLFLIARGISFKEPQWQNTVQVLVDCNVRGLISCNWHKEFAELCARHSIVPIKLTWADMEQLLQFYKSLQAVKPQAMEIEVELRYGSVYVSASGDEDHSITFENAIPPDTLHPLMEETPTGRKPFASA